MSLISAVPFAVKSVAFVWDRNAMAKEMEKYV
jgi:hypothetical protein